MRSMLLCAWRREYVKPHAARVVLHIGECSNTISSTGAKAKQLFRRGKASAKAVDASLYAGAKPERSGRRTG